MEATRPDTESPLDPQHAAELLRTTEQEARRQFTHQTPLLSFANAAAILLIYGALWQGSRDHHPYTGPSLGSVGFVYIVVAVLVVVCVSAYVRATSGVTGPTRRVERLDAVPVLAAVVGVYVFIGALAFDGFTHAVVYGVVDAAGPWLVVGAVLAGLAAAREDWWKLAAAVAVVATGAGAAFAGPAGVWGVLAICGCLLFLAQAVLRYRWERQAVGTA